VYQTAPGGTSTCAIAKERPCYFPWEPKKLASCRVRPGPRRVWLLWVRNAKVLKFSLCSKNRCPPVFKQVASRKGNGCDNLRWKGSREKIGEDPFTRYQWTPTTDKSSQAKKGELRPNTQKKSGGVDLYSKKKPIRQSQTGVDQRKKNDNFQLHRITSLGRKGPRDWERGGFITQF